MGSTKDLNAGSTDVDEAYNAKVEPTLKFLDSEGDTGNQPKQSRKRWIMIGAAGIIVAVTIAVIVVIVVVVNQKKKSDDDGEKSKYSKECGPFKLPGLNFSDLSPTIISHSYTCPLKGDCWSGEKCFQCFKLDTWKVGNINNIPVCCPDCLVRGLKISNSECNCRFNGR